MSAVARQRSRHYLTNLLIEVIMLVAVYVHLHPDVPAETLPFQSKSTVVTIIVLLLAGLNAYLYRKNAAEKDRIRNVLGSSMP